MRISRFLVFKAMNSMEKSSVLLRDIEDFCKTFALQKELHGSSFLITGATGLIGSILVRCLLALDEGVKIIAPVRNVEKAKSLFGDDIRLQIVECNLSSFDYSSLGKVDYVVHCAAPTSSRFFVEKPVDTFNIIINGTQRLLEYAKSEGVKGFAFLSSLEVYGTITDDSLCVSEDVQGYLDPMSVRSSYPMAKRAAENLCALYASQYGVPAKIVRLTQTTGAGISKDDNRVIAQFARCAANGEDIVLHTTGESARPYCYTIDSVSAILYVLLKGKAGEAYNVANEETYISARGMAEYLRENFNHDIDVRVEIADNMGYAPVTKLRLSTSKIQSLGWLPNYDLNRIFRNLIDYIAE